MATEKQREAVRRYQKKTKAIMIRFFPSDMDLHDWIRKHENMSGYIKDLVRKDMEESNS